MSLFGKTSFRSERSRRRHQRRQMIKTGVIALVFVLCLIGVALGARLQVLTIGAVSVAGGETVPHDVVRSHAEAALSGTYALLIPKRFAYTYPHDAIVSNIQSIPRVRDVWVERTSHTDVAITFTEHDPYALWCDTHEDTASSSPVCLFVNETGYAFGDAPELQGGTLERYVVEGRLPVIGEYVFGPEMFTVIEEFATALARQYALRIRAVTETADKDIIFHLSNSGDILIAANQPIQEVFDNLVSIFSSEEFKSLTSADFEYIDLRFGNQVYLKEFPTPPVSDEVATNTEPEVEEE